MAMTPEDMSALVGAFYDGLLGRSSAEIPLDRLKERLQASRVVLVLRRGSTEGEQVVLGSRGEFVDSQGPGQGSPHVTGADAWLEDGGVCSLRAFRQRSQPAFGPHEQSLCQALVPHLGRALAIRRRLDSAEAERQFHSSVMDRLMVGAILLDGRGQIIRATPMAKALLGSGDGLRSIARRPHASSALEDRELQRMIRAAIRGSWIGARPGRAIAVSRPSGARNLGLVVQGLEGPDRDDATPRVAAAIFIRDAERIVEVAADIVRELFGLTPAEAELARRLAEGLSLAEAARILDIRRNTARAHLRAIFSKTGITRQTELVRVLLNSAAVLGSGGEVAAQRQFERVEAA